MKNFIGFKTILVFAVFCGLGFAWADGAGAQTKSSDFAVPGEGIEAETQNTATKDELFEAKVVQILEERVVKTNEGKEVKQQRVALRGTEGEWKDKEVIFNGISDIIAIKGNEYKKGDRVIVSHQVDSEGEDVFYIADYVRRWPLYLLAFIFALAITLVGKAKGLRSLISLGISFAIILKLTIPLILTGWNPLAVGIGTCILIFLLMIYLTDGWNTKAHLAILSLTVSLIIVALLSLLFTWLAKLTGMAGEETLFLLGIGQQALDFKGLFLAGVLIGALGVLDDMVIGQIEAVAQIKEANPKLPEKKIFSMAMEVGNAHIGAMVNTLFLAYAGASLPLLILFSINEPPFLSFGQVINHELIASEIVRTLVGSIGLALAMPIATYLASYFYQPQTKN
ncbi:hypothetical protein GF391_00540 [Candidatus Uhrbacteria bacterium]|nr:hypothetical protein [Candidatus Uhrbacteria bacterium]